VQIFLIAGECGVVFAVGGCRDDRVLYKLTSSWSSAESFGETWYETPIMMFPRLYPVVSLAVGAGMGHKLVVAGGGSGFFPAHRAVEVFDSESGKWFAVLCESHYLIMDLYFCCNVMLF